MKNECRNFWDWFIGFAQRVEGSEASEDDLNELLAQIHVLDDRVFFELSTNTSSKELVFTAQGEVSLFPTIENIVGAAPQIEGWSFIALKQPMGFDFTHQNEQVVLNAAELWFLPLKSEANPSAMVIELGVPDADLVLTGQSIDIAYTILETGIGERSCALDIQQIYVGDLPEAPAAQGYIELPELASYIAWHKSKQPTE